MNGIPSYDEVSRPIEEGNAVNIKSWFLPQPLTKSLHSPYEQNLQRLKDDDMTKFLTGSMEFQDC